MASPIRVLFVDGNEGGSEAADQHRINCLTAALVREGVHAETRTIAQKGSLLRGRISRQFRARWAAIPWDEFDFVLAYAAIHAWMLSLQPRKHGKLIFDCQGLRYAEVALQELRGLNKLRVPVLRFIEERAARKSDLCLTVSRPLARHLSAWRGGEQGLAIVRNGVDAAAFTPGKGRNDGVFRVGYAGAFQSWQAVDLLIEAAGLLAHRTDIRWRIIGFGPGDRMIRERFAAQMPPGSELYDRCDRKRLRELLLDCNLLTIPRKPFLACEVALPTKFAEYLSMAKPVVVFTVDETQQIVAENQCGFVARPDGRSLADAVESAAGMSASELDQMGKAGREFVLRELNWDVIGRKFHDFLRSNMQ